jgi:hypothetical protein
VSTQKKELKVIPGFSQGVRENSAARTIKMARPICPNSKVEMERTPEGKMVPKQETDPNRQNCQKAGIGWWEECEAKGHNPYFTTRIWYSKEDKFGPDPENPEQTIKLGEKTVRHETQYPNIAQVAAHIRVNSGQGPRVKMKAAGFKRLSDIGYEEVCQFRNCQKPVRVTSNVGQYCSKNHAVLIAADIHGLLQYQTPGFGPDWDLGIEMQVEQKRRRWLTDSAQTADLQDVKKK